VPVQNILAITFTKKAAGEIRSRIEESILSALSSDTFDGKTLSALERQALIEARALLPEAAFSTIHDFALNIVHRAPTLAGFPSLEGLQIGSNTDSLLERIVDKCLTETENQQKIDELSSEGISYSFLKSKLT